MKANVRDDEDEIFLALALSSRCVKQWVLDAQYACQQMRRHRKEIYDVKQQLSNTGKDSDPIYTEVSTTLSPPRSPPKHIAKRVRLSSALSHLRSGSEARKARHGRTVAWIWLSVITKCTTMPGKVGVKLEPAVDHNVVPMICETVADLV